MMKNLTHFKKLKNNINKPNSHTQVGIKLMQMIQSCLLQVGDELPSERELAAMFEVSRETARAAIQKLAAKGFVQIRHGVKTKILRTAESTPSSSNIFFHSWDSHSLYHVKEARTQIEVTVIRNAAKYISQKDLNRLERLLTKQRILFEDPIRFQVSDRLFHTIIYQACKNPILAQLAGDLYSYALDYRRQALKRPGAIEQSYKDHCLVLEALQNHDSVAAELAMLSHLNQVNKTTEIEMANRTLINQD
jgi:DNA-binding FadR family transcriptional regulator